MTDNKISIKFRVWDGTKYIFDAFIHDGRAYEYVEDYGGTFSSGKILSIIKNATIQHFTGLKDKNHKNIFEGDILCNPMRLAMFPENMYVSHHQIDNTLYWALTRNWNGKPYPIVNTWVDGEVEVIGNIYENPELLKEHNEPDNQIQSLE